MASPLAKYNYDWHIVVSTTSFFLRCHEANSDSREKGNKLHMLMERVIKSVWLSLVHHDDSSATNI
jgi:hypothetical protein